MAINEMLSKRRRWLIDLVLHIFNVILSLLIIANLSLPCLSCVSRYTEEAVNDNTNSRFKLTRFRQKRQINFGCYRGAFYCGDRAQAVRCPHHHFCRMCSSCGPLISHSDTMYFTYRSGESPRSTPDHKAISDCLRSYTWPFGTVEDSK